MSAAVTPKLTANIAAAAVLICDAKQDADKVHELIKTLCDQAWNEGKLAGLDRAEELFNKHLRSLKT